MLVDNERLAKLLGGALGLSALPLESPISTRIIFRSVADIAQSEQHDLSLIPIQLSYLEVLAFGGNSTKDYSVKSGYCGVRIALPRARSEAAAYIAEKCLAEETRRSSPSKLTEQDNSQQTGAIH